MNNIVLIGMPSCGKSTVGVILAKKLGYRFSDSDLLIQEREGMLLHEIISERGNDGFLLVENEVNKSLDVNKTVISTGGSVVYCDEAMEHLKSIGKVVYIDISYDTLVRRLGDFSHSGVIIKNGSTLYDMYCERRALYEKYADITVSGEDGSLSQTLDALCEALKMSEN